MSIPSPAPTTVRVGVMMEGVQLSDIVGIDILGNLETNFVSKLAALSPAHATFLSSSIPFEFFYIATTLDPAATATPPSFRFLPNVTYDTCPRDLDIVITGGPFLDHRPEPAVKFIREAWGKTRVWITTCIGSLWIAHAGVLEGKGLRCTANRMGLSIARHLYPGVEWVDQRWVVEEKEYDGGRGGGKGELWTSGGAGCGIDMIATFALKNYDEKMVRVLALDSLEFDPEGSHGQYYRTEKYQFPEFAPTLPGSEA